MLGFRVQAEQVTESLHGCAELGGGAAGDVQAAAAPDVVQLLLTQQCSGRHLRL